MSEKEYKIVVIEGDEVARNVIAGSLLVHGLDSIVCVKDSVDFKAGSGDCHFYVCEKGDEPDIASAHIFTKPLRLGALLDRILYQVQVEGAGSVERLVIGRYDLDVAHNTLVLRETGETLRLTEKETEILQLLYDADGELVSRTALLEQVWGYVQGVETHTLETHMYRLRQKIEDDAGAPVLLLTDENGYRLGDG